MAAAAGVDGDVGDAHFLWVCAGGGGDAADLAGGGGSLFHLVEE